VNRSASIYTSDKEKNKIRYEDRHSSTNIESNRRNRFEKKVLTSVTSITISHTSSTNNRQLKQKEKSHIHSVSLYGNV
jgi:hypothetical protein